ncbi:MAG: hypothetical protein U0470_11290 [Anaerolineae bacterium]
MNEISNPEGAPTTRRPFEPLFPSAELPPSASPSSPSPPWTPPSSTPSRLPSPPPPPPAEQSHSRPQRRRLPVVAALALRGRRHHDGGPGGRDRRRVDGDVARVAGARSAPAARTAATNGDVFDGQPAGSTVAAESLLEAVRARTRPAVDGPGTSSTSARPGVRRRS